MASPLSSAPSPKPRTFSSAIAVLNSIKASIATAATVQTYTGAALDGASASPLPGGKTGFAQWPAATASSSAGSYINASTVVFTGTYKGVAVTRTATVSGTGGNATFIADGPVDGAVTKIVVGAQSNTSGAWTFGFVDLECRKILVDGTTYRSEPWRQVRGGSVGNVGIVLLDDTAEILPCIEGEVHPVLISRLKTSTTTCTTITLYE